RRLCALGAGDRILRERLAELAGRRLEGAPDAGLGLRERCELRLLEVDVRLVQLEVAEMPQGAHVLRPEASVLEPRGNRLAGAPLCLEHLGEVAAGRRVEWPVLHRLLRLRERAAGGALVAERVAQELPEVETAGADAQEDEAAREDDDQDDERPLRLAAQAREEHRVVGYACGAAATTAASAAGGTASMARLALCAAAVSSCHSIPPFS